MLCVSSYLSPVLPMLFAMKFSICCGCIAFHVNSVCLFLKPVMMLIDGDDDDG